MGDTPSPGWLPFHSWLQQQRKPEATNSDEDDSGSQSQANNSNSHLSSEQQTPIQDVTPASNNVPTKARNKHAISLARDCRTETRLVDGCARERQEMTIMLSAPGMELHKCPLITAKQAGQLLSALCEPLVQVHVGRLTRRLESPTILHPTKERGTLSLWLLPNDDLSLVWQGRRSIPSPTSSPKDGTSTTTKMPPMQSNPKYNNEDATPTTTNTNHREDIHRNNDIPSSSTHNATPSSSTPLLMDVEDASCEVTSWEELVRFPTGSLNEHMIESLVIIHVLRGDKTGRSFYIRPHGEIPAAPSLLNTPPSSTDGNSTGNSTGDNSSTHHGVNASSFPLHNPPCDHASSLPSSSSSASACTTAFTNKTNADTSDDGHRRMYFWLTGPDLTSAIHSLGRLKSLIKRPPSLAKKSGVSTAQLEEISRWIKQLDAMHGGMQPAGLGPSAAAISLQQVQNRALSGRRRADLHGNDDAEKISALGTVSATAAAVYKDRRFQIACPCSVSVGASVLLQARVGETSGGGGNVEGGEGREIALKDLSSLATLRAKSVAEEVAREIVDSLGQQRIEESICESLIRSMRTQRAKAKAEKQQKREKQQRAQMVADVQPLIKKAVDHAILHGGISAVSSSKAASTTHTSSSNNNTSISNSTSSMSDHRGPGALLLPSFSTSTITTTDSPADVGDESDGRSAPACNAHLQSTLSTAVLPPPSSVNVPSSMPIPAVVDDSASAKSSAATDDDDDETRVNTHNSGDDDDDDDDDDGRSACLKSPLGSTPEYRRVTIDNLKRLLDAAGIDPLQETAATAAATTTTAGAAAAAAATAEEAGNGGAGSGKLPVGDIGKVMSHHTCDAAVEE